MSIFLSRREKAVFLCALSLIFSPNSLRNKFGLNEDAIYEIKEVILDAFPETEEKERQLSVESSERVEKLIETLEGSIIKETGLLENIINKLSNEELEFRQFKLSNKTERCKRINRNKAEYVKRYAKRAFRKWKKKLLSQKGKGKGNFRIDQLAEDVIFKT